MQIPADPLDAAALEAALAPGQERYFRHVLLADWNRDGGFSHALSVLAQPAASVKVNRELNDATPGSNVTLSGASAGQLTVTLTGSMLVGSEYVPVAEIFSPYNTASSLYGISPAGVPIIWRIETYTSRGWISTDQFVGWIDEISTRRSSNRVEIDAIDIPPALRDPTFWPPWAVDGPAAARIKNYDPQRGLASSVVDSIFNSAGLRTRPRPPWESSPTSAIALCWLPLCGSFAPQAGKQISQYPWGNFQLFPEVYPISPGFNPNGEYWVDGPFGLARHGEQYIYPGSLIYTCRDQQPMWSGYSTSVSSWIYCGPTAPGYDASTAATLRPQVVAVYFGYGTGSGNYYAYRLSIATAGATLQVQVENGTNVLRYGTYTPGTNAWRHVHAQLDHSTGSVVRCKLIVDGTTQVDFTGSTGSTTTPTALNVLFLPQVGFHLRPGVRISDAMTWQEAGAPAVTPERTVTVGATVDRSYNEIAYLPAPGDPGWDVVKNIAAAEYGAALIDEQGIAHWKNRDTIRSTDDPVTITLQYPSDMGTLESESGRANTAQVAARGGEASWQEAWGMPSVDYIVGTPGVQEVIVPLDDDVIAIESGTVPRLYQSADSASTLPVWSGSVNHGYVFVYDSTETESDDQNMVLLTDQSGLGDKQQARIVVTNTDTRTGRFRLKSDGTAGTDPQPALRIAGLILAKPPSESSIVTSQANVDADGKVRTIDIPAGEWHQYLASVEASAAFALLRTTQPIPTFDRIILPGDPRRQITDSLIMTFGTSGQRICAYVVGIERTYSSDGLRDTLTVRASHAPGRWALGDAVLGVIGLTAIVG